MALVTVQDVVAGYGAGDILQGTCLSVEQGSITCIVGPNGAGKSTLLKVVSGLLRPRLGEVMFQGKPLVGKSCTDILRCGIVQVPQSGIMFNRMTVLENVLMGAYPLKDSKLVRRRLDEVSELFPIVRERAKDKAGTLSGGQQRLVAFARGLMMDPILVLLDEPSVGLDPRSSKQAFDTVKLMQQTGKTVLMVEQNVRVGLGVATHAVVMESGRVRMEGPSERILSDPRMHELYLGAGISRSAPEESN